MAKVFLEGMVGRSKECGHICTVIVWSRRNKKRQVVEPYRKMAKLCDKCGVREKIPGDMLAFIMRLKAQEK